MSSEKEEKIDTDKIDTDKTIQLFDLTQPHISRQQITELLGFKPIDLNPYRQSLVHKSLQMDIQNSKNIQEYMKQSNERMEYLGDAVFNLVVANYLYKKYGDKDEGFMTRMRTKIVRGSHCAKFSKIIGLQKYILTGKNTVRVKDKNGIVYNEKVLEDAFEAFVGAIFLDLGFSYADNFISKLIDEHVDFLGLTRDENYKDILMRYTQVNGYEFPLYKVIEQSGPPHNKKFIVSVSLIQNKNSRSIEVGIGQGSSKKMAEQNAAKASLCKCKRQTCKKIHYSDLDGIINRDQIQ